MKDSETRRLDMLRRVRDYVETHAAQFAAGSKGRELFDALQGEINSLEEHAAAQVSGKSDALQGTGSREDARQALYQQIKAINLTAHSMAFEIPGLDDKFRMPRGNNDQTLLNTARAFAADAAPLNAQFIRYEMAASFLTDLDAAINAFEQAVSHQNQGRENATASTVSLGASTERGVSLVRQLDAIVRNKFRDDPAALAAWKSVTRIEHAPQPKTPPQKPAEPTT
ncbi:MAG: hypothetical protein QOD00_1148 [Blastocatellia bacterium]|jgi:hypothetical protein|nr:hypothetical protein [Blastocatellia bacterium]